MRALRKADGYNKNATHIRQSMIIHWLGSYNLREVQFMAGHRWGGSTERYRNSNMEDLLKDIDRYHPLKY